MLNNITLNVKSVVLVKRSNLAKRRGDALKSNYLMIRAIDLHVPQQALNA